MKAPLSDLTKGCNECQTCLPNRYILFSQDWNLFIKDVESICKVITITSNRIGTQVIGSIFKYNIKFGYSLNQGKFMNAV